MKARMRNYRMHGGTILEGKGKQFSEVAAETERNFANWLSASSISEEKFMELADSDQLYLTFWADEDSAIAILHCDEGEIAAPLVWQKGNGIGFEEYKMDAALLLLHVSSKCRNQTAAEKLKDFVRTKLTR